MYIKETLDGRPQLVCGCDSQWFDSKTGKCTDCQCEPDAELIQELEARDTRPG